MYSAPLMIACTSLIFIIYLTTNVLSNKGKPYPFNAL